MRAARRRSAACRPRTLSACRTSILRAVALLRNANVPMIKDRYACVIDSAGIQQLALGDSRFGDRVEAFKDSKQRVLSAGDTIDYAGVLFTVQSDPYRCHLPGAGGELRVRKNAVKVRGCHSCGENAWGYLDLGAAGSKQRQLLAPNFKVQDITVTGNHKLDVLAPGEVRPELRTLGRVKSTLKEGSECFAEASGVAARLRYDPGKRPVGQEAGVLGEQAENDAVQVAEEEQGRTLLGVSVWQELIIGGLKFLVLEKPPVLQAPRLTSSA